MARCEDYPCCGHTDGLPCDWKPPTDYPHAGCDHEAGYCQVWEEENDDSDLGDGPRCESCWSPIESVNGVWEHTFSEDNNHKVIYVMEDAE